MMNRSELAGHVALDAIHYLHSVNDGKIMLLYLRIKISSLGEFETAEIGSSTQTTCNRTVTETAGCTGPPAPS